MATSDKAEHTRRDFLYIATGAFGAVGAAALAWPFIDQMNPDASALALASIEVDVSSLEEGQGIVAKWRGKPIFIRYRTQAEIDAAKAVDVASLRDPQTDVERTKPGKEQWLVQIGICTHLGCVPLGESGDYEGWFCPCHGSHYDTAGRIRKGPAPLNLEIPPYEFLSDTVIKIG
ncbi:MULTISPECIES: ubiquinol-cytochrome c reductase iron-sulfur subunit [Cohaesibacter]|uniref:ubiquinol-cytochrome c reductase iron-sulfur subunit n=1 Tax=Cohaesibacter TaxID=655352 RepID=UPI000DE81519|nr:MULTISPECIES: ubiquinol-cytochrome c reductase iron-sulfur subunit [Cohaesibacter]TLP48304.1 ubiquinol-cytochrome c reductase iron-sulfur subunit [Cohaesibacter sp. CAU 1516]